MPRDHRPELGWLGEHLVDMDVVRGSGFRVVPWIPLVDAHGIDRAYSLDGIGKPSMVQIKTSGSLDEVGRYHWTVRVGSPRKLDGVSMVLAISEPSGWPTGDIYWCLDATAVRKLASKEYDRALRAEVYELAAYPTREDKLSSYRLTRTELWRRLIPGEPLLQEAPLEFPALELDQGGVYEFATITDIMIGNRKDLRSSGRPSTFMVATSSSNSLDRRMPATFKSRGQGFSGVTTRFVSACGAQPSGQLTISG